MASRPASTPAGTSQNTAKGQKRRVTSAPSNKRLPSVRRDSQETLPLRNGNGPTRTTRKNSTVTRSPRVTWAGPGTSNDSSQRRPTKSLAESGRRWSSELRLQKDAKRSPAGVDRRWSSELRTQSTTGRSPARSRRRATAPAISEVSEPSTEELAQFAAEAERQRAELEAVKQAAAARAAEHAKLLGKVKEVNTRIVVRRCATHWRTTTENARFAGPFLCPQSERQMATMQCAKRATPKDTVVAFLLAVMKYKRDRLIGEKMLSPVLHPDLLLGTSDSASSRASAGNITLESTSSTRAKLRKSTKVRLQSLGENTLASYVLGTLPSNGYAYDPDNVNFAFSIRLSDKNFDKKDERAKDGDKAVVHIITSGALPPTRAVKLTRVDGQWAVHDFANLCTNVHPPVDIAAAVVEDTVTPRRHNPNDRGYVDGKIRIYDSRGNVIGYEPTRASLSGTYLPDLRCGKNGFATGFTPAPKYVRAKAQRRESEVDLAARHDRARSSVQDHAAKLAAAEMLKKWNREPGLPRRVVTSGQLEPAKSLNDVLRMMKARGSVLHASPAQVC